MQHLEDMHDKVNKVLQLAEICSKYEHTGDQMTQDVEYDFESVDFEHLDKAMIVSWCSTKKMNKYTIGAEAERSDYCAACRGLDSIDY